MRRCHKQNTIRAFAVAVLMAVSATALAEDQHTYHAQVNGLACPFCVYGLERSLGKLENVDSVTVNLKTGSIRISMRDGAKLDEVLVRETTEDAGFTLAAFGRAIAIIPQVDDG